MALEREGASGSGWIFTKDMRLAFSEQESYGYRAAFTREGNGKYLYFHVMPDKDGQPVPAYEKRYAHVGPVISKPEGLGFYARERGETTDRFVLMPEETAS